MICGLPILLAIDKKGTSWTTEELLLIDSLRISKLPLPPDDPSNKVSLDDRAASMGHQLFFDQRLSLNNTVSCSTCHIPEKYFSDGRQFPQGLQTGKRNTMSLLGVAYSPWFSWDGRQDSLWAQALSPLENELEHGATRAAIVELIRSDKNYRQQYERIFGDFTDQDKNNQSINKDLHTTPIDPIDIIFSNVGKALAAYQTQIIPGPGPFDRYADALLSGNPGNEHISGAAQEGLKLFIGRANCINCHNGPLLTNNEFHNTGVIPSKNQLPSFGRSSGLRDVFSNAFNCTSRFSDSANNCPELNYAKTGKELVGAHRTPSLRNISETAPYMHAGQIKTIADVLNHYNNAEISILGHNEAKPLNLNPSELLLIEDFLLSLTGPIHLDNEWLRPPIR